MKLIFVAFAAIALVSAQGYAEGQISFTIEQGIASYAMRHFTTKSAETADKKESENALITTPDSLQVCGGLDNFNLYFYPTQPGTARSGIVAAGGMDYLFIARLRQGCVGKNPGYTS